MKNKMINVLCFCCGFVLYNGCNLKSCENFWNMSDNVYICICNFGNWNLFKYKIILFVEYNYIYFLLYL